VLRQKVIVASVELVVLSKGALGRRGKISSKRNVLRQKVIVASVELVVLSKGALGR